MPAEGGPRGAGHRGWEGGRPVSGQVYAEALGQLLECGEGSVNCVVAVVTIVWDSK